jgi:hypothetical protein
MFPSWELMRIVDAVRDADIFIYPIHGTYELAMTGQETMTVNAG